MFIVLLESSWLVCSSLKILLKCHGPKCKKMALLLRSWVNFSYWNRLELVAHRGFYSIYQKKHLFPFSSLVAWRCHIVLRFSCLFKMLNETVTIQGYFHELCISALEQGIRARNIGLYFSKMTLILSLKTKCTRNCGLVHEELHMLSRMRVLEQRFFVEISSGP